MATPNHQEAIAKLKGMLSSCTLCPRHCRVDRTRGEPGFCRLGDEIVMDCALVHHGEEPPLSGSRGAGTIFFSSCNLKCLYCQNYQISHDIRGERLDSAALARIMLSLRDRGCHNIEPVTPTPQTPQIMEALLLAREQGLQLPFIYNCGGYEEPEVIKLLDGMVDIYLPDCKYGLDEDGLLFSGVKDYPVQALASIQEMVRQVGYELETEDDIARRGLLIRHLVLPGRTENSFAALRIIKKNISLRVSLSIMAQYTPIPNLARHTNLGRRLTRPEYEAVVNYALDLGIENIFTQEVSDRHLSPDFNEDDPFGSL
ncbi:MAG: radical SAM protein [Syntrophales bacterium LBB04]|nr:radical SAM protein [Syntrophales bacterium LBB04]